MRCCFLYEFTHLKNPPEHRHSPGSVLSSVLLVVRLIMDLMFADRIGQRQVSDGGERVAG